MTTAVLFYITKNEIVAHERPLTFKIQCLERLSEVDRKLKRPEYLTISSGYVCEVLLLFRQHTPIHVYERQADRLIC